MASLALVAEPIEQPLTTSEKHRILYALYDHQKAQTDAFEMARCIPNTNFQPEDFGLVTINRLIDRFA